jgi:alkylhydroperoxidase/carboxymuconolactone decarboxylase family protein YurZ
MQDDDQAREEIYAQIRERRGFLLPVHELLGTVDPEILRRYNELASYLIFSPEPRGLDLKTRFLVMIGITTAVKGDREGIEWSMRRAKELGATEQEVLEAVALAALPAGVPAVEYAARAWQEVQEGKGWVEHEDGSG